MREDIETHNYIGANEEDLQTLMGQYIEYVADKTLLFLGPAHLDGNLPIDLYHFKTSTIMVRREKLSSAAPMLDTGTIKICLENILGVHLNEEKVEPLLAGVKSNA